ncbi:hypothetical protein ATV_gp22 [Bicaudavirus pozzuoliense]|uniref:Uncharacterized protein ORF115 n=2 Tax=Acidianus two-tailed virus TaxID=315953 RepID=Y115_ATV|nr:hypothetical protein ATV_gp22 [Acidianus two-tailed virus]Q3V4S4.1 RecName: Full=Uncharacterized protein ORF115 [Acidianus two-tailed virus]CAI59890.1 hypothetical protein [Acidianus two-tailed virus]
METKLVQSIVIKTEAKVSTVKYRKKVNGERREYKLYFVRFSKDASIKLEKMGVRKLKNVEIIYEDEKYVLGSMSVRIWSRTSNDNTALYGLTLPKPIGEKLAGKKVLVLAEIESK